jgi:hypothetical protein
MDVCILSQDGEVVLHRNMTAAPEPFLQAVAPSRDGLGVAGECLFTWYGLADLWAPAGLPFVLGHAWYRQALHGGQAKHETIDAQNIALLLRGGRLPQASVDPAEMRATRALLRRRLPLTRKRAERLAHVQHPNSQDTWPERGKTLADKGHRAGVAARFPEPAVPKSVAVARALIAFDDP